MSAAHSEADSLRELLAGAQAAEAAARQAAGAAAAQAAEEHGAELLRLTQTLADAEQRCEQLEQRLNALCQAELSELSARMAVAER